LLAEAKFRSFIFPLACNPEVKLPRAIPDKTKRPRTTMYFIDNKILNLLLKYELKSSWTTRIAECKKNDAAGEKASPEARKKLISTSTFC